MDRFKLSAKDIKEGMAEVTDATVHWWAYLYWTDELKDYEEDLKNASDDDQISFFRYCVVEAKKLLSSCMKILLKCRNLAKEHLANPTGWMNS